MDDEATFKPQIDPNSKRLMTERTEALRGSNITVFDQLTQDAIRRKMRQEEYSNWYPEEATFQPQINDASRFIAEKARTSSFSVDGSGRGLKSHGLDDISEEMDTRLALVDRLAATRARGARDAALDQARKQAALNIDPKTGEPARAGAFPSSSAAGACPAFPPPRLPSLAPRSGKPFFKPETGRPPAFGRDLRGKHVGEYLYERAKDYAERKQQLSSMLEDKKRRDAESFRTLEKSQKMLEK